MTAQTERTPTPHGGPHRRGRKDRFNVSARLDPDIQTRLDWAAGQWRVSRNDALNAALDDALPTEAEIAAVEKARAIVVAERHSYQLYGTADDGQSPPYRLNTERDPRVEDLYGTWVEAVIAARQHMRLWRDEGNTDRVYVRHPDGKMERVLK